MHWSELTQKAIAQNFIKIEQREAKRLKAPIGEWYANDGKAISNQDRNRYRNVYPWDKNRVHLPVKSGSDYINASYIRLKENTYIACQGPTFETVYQFWAMCFHEAEKRNESDIIIVMVTPLQEGDREKCERYWKWTKTGPVDIEFHKSNIEHNSDISLEPLSLEFIKFERLEDYTFTTMILKSGNISKTVHHYYYTYWADARVPFYPESLIGLSKEMRRVMQTQKVEVPIIHCSAGVGRTGTFIAMDYLYHHQELLEEEDPILDVFDQLRNDRIMMIQTVHQYQFLYKFFRGIYESNSGGNNSSGNNSSGNNSSGNNSSEAKVVYQEEKKSEENSGETKLKEKEPEEKN